MKREHEGASVESSSTNKADMSWLLNAGGGDSDEGGRGEPAPKARKHDSLAVDGSVRDWLREAPGLYQLAAHAGIVAGIAVGGGSGHSSSASTVAGDDTAGRIPASLPQFAAEAAGTCKSKAHCNPAARTPAHGENSPSNETASSQSSDTSREKDCDGDSRRKSWSVSLDESLAIQIYASRPRNAGSKYGSMAEAVRLGERHGVSPKTIRDIWNRKSWVKVTRAYWTAAEASAYVPRRHRPASPRESGRGASPKRRSRGTQGGKAG
jgi:hypothetical protein